MTELAIENYVGMPVKAVRLTAENAQTVADWIGGQLSTRDITIKSDEGKNTVKSTRVYLNRNQRRKNELPNTKSNDDSSQRRKGGAWHFGSVGDWFIMDADGFVRIFPDEKFSGIFLKVSDAIISELTTN